LRLTDEQKSIVNYKGKFLVVIAYAGCGKTSTLVKFVERRENETFLYIVFNKLMQREAQEKFKKFKNITIKTAHSIAWNHVNRELNLSKRLKEKSLNGYQAYQVAELIRTDEQIAKVIIDKFNEFLHSDLELKEFVELELNRANKSKKDKMIEYFLKEYSLEDIYKESLKNINNFSISHDFYLKFFQLKRKKLRYDYILYDEAQDVSSTMAKIVIDQSAKKVFVGDDYQSIYSFRGAKNIRDILDSMSIEYDLLHLTNTFRFKRDTLSERLANRLLRALRAEKPLIARGEKTAHTTDKKTIICRTNGKVIEVATDLIEQNRAIYTDISKDSIQKIIDIANICFNEDCSQEIRTKELKVFNNGEDLKQYAKDTRDQNLLSMINIVNRNGADIYEKINLIRFNETKKDDAEISIITAHKSKGQEYQNVLIEKDFKLYEEIKGANGELEMKIPIEEELKLLYVTITRATENLEINSDVAMQINELNMWC